MAKCIDITKYSKNELSLIVFNTERLYKLRSQPRAALYEYLRLEYKFTTEQFEILIEDIEADLADLAL